MLCNLRVQSWDLRNFKNNGPAGFWEPQKQTHQDAFSKPKNWMLASSFKHCHKMPMGQLRSGNLQCMPERVFWKLKKQWISAGSFKNSGWKMQEFRLQDARIQAVRCPWAHVPAGVRELNIYTPNAFLQSSTTRISRIA